MAARRKLTRDRGGRSPIADDAELAAFLVMAADRHTLERIAEQARIFGDAAPSRSAIQRFLSRPFRPPLRALRDLVDPDGFDRSQLIPVDPA